MLRICLSLIATLAPLAAAIHGPVRVEGGLLEGVALADSSVTAFKGVPYAAPPVGELRWRAPRPTATWEGIRKADQFSANCMQRIRDSFGPWTAEFQPHGTVSEDCLYLNVWTAAPAAGEKYPVAVHFHGGAFTDGSGSVPVYDGENLAKKDVVVVTVNYRVNVLGFFAHPELTKESEHHSSGNYGLLDQLAALEWVRRNAAAFGGDPKRITVMGQSAGAMSVHYLTASPLAKGLFARAIAQSGANVEQGPGKRLAQAERDGVRFTESKGAHSIAELRAMPADALLPATGGAGFGPIVDGWFLPMSVDEVFAQGHESDVATLTGWDFDEGSFNANYGKASAEEFRKQIRRDGGSQAEALVTLYLASTQAEAEESQKALARERAMVSMYLWAARRAKTGKTAVYTYLFTHVMPGPARDRYLAFHSSELPYVFNNLNQSSRPWTQEDRKIAEAVSDYWVNFIRTGDPNGKGLPEWPAFREGSATIMELGERMGPRPIASPAKVEALTRALAPGAR
jgi:para-nitrobenzyl esterase